MLSGRNWFMFLIKKACCLKEGRMKQNNSLLMSFNALFLL